MITFLASENNREMEDTAISQLSFLQTLLKASNKISLVMASSSASNINLTLGPNSNYYDVRGDLNNYTIVLNQGKRHRPIMYSIMLKSF